MGDPNKPNTNHGNEVPRRCRKGNTTREVAGQTPVNSIVWIPSLCDE